MYWNYRVLMLKDNFNRPSFEFHEVHYDENDKIYAWTECHNLAGDTLEDLKETYEYMATAFEQPVLKVVDNKLVEVEECVVSEHDTNLMFEALSFNL